MNDNNFKILVKAKLLNKNLIKDLDNIVKNKRYIKYRTINTSFDLIQLIIYTNTLDSQMRREKLGVIYSKISMINYYLEVLNEEGLITKKKLLLRCDLLNELKNMIYAWIKSSQSNV